MLHIVITVYTFKQEVLIKCTGFCAHCMGPPNEYLKLNALSSLLGDSCVPIGEIHVLTLDTSQVANNLMVRRNSLGL